MASVLRDRQRTLPSKTTQIFFSVTSLAIIVYILFIWINNQTNTNKFYENYDPNLQVQDDSLSKWKWMMFPKVKSHMSSRTMNITTVSSTTTEEVPKRHDSLKNVTVIHKNLTVADFVKNNLNSENRITDKSLIGFPHKICGCGKYKPPDRGIHQRNLTNIASTCSHEATQYGTGQKVRSYSLFIHEAEDLPRYVLPFEDNMKAHSEIFPGWITRVYSNISTVNPHVCGLICKYETLFWCDITNIPELGNLSEMHGRTWRFLPLGDPTVDIVLSRDLDNTVFTRERAAVADWEASNLPFHTMRDNPGMGVGMLAGMWGAKNFMLGSLFRKFLQKMLITAAKQNILVENWDEEILKKYVYTPYASLMFLAHDSYYCKKFKDFKTLPFSTQRFEDQTVGEHYIKNVTKWTYSVPPCPVECRPAYGKDCGSFVNNSPFI